MKLLLAVLAVLMIVPLGVRADDAAAERAALLSGVRAIAAPGIPGTLRVFGKDAFPLVVGQAGDKYREPVLAIGVLGRGRVVAWGHDGYFGREALDKADTGRLMTRAVDWAAGSKGATGSAIIGVIGQPELAAFLQAQGKNAESLRANGIADALKRLDVVCAVLSGLTDAERNAIAAFVRNGGGLIAAETGWGWLQTHPGKTLAENGGNRVLAPAGIVWSGGMLEPTADNKTFATDAPPSPLTHAGRALDALTASDTSLPADESAQAVWTLTQAAQTLPPDDKLLMPRLQKLAHRTLDPDLAAHPVGMDAPLDRLALTLQVRDAATRPAEKIAAHPAAASFPGSVPDGAPRIERLVVVDTSVPDWHSTGLYAAPGETITVTVPENAVGKGLSVRIGAHKDTLWHLASWKRAPQITRTFPLMHTTTRAANAFGGPVYIEVPDGAGPEKINVTIAHVVAAPFFVRGKTSASEWKTQRDAPAPWAELAGNNVVLTVPSSVVRALENPDALMAYWDGVVDHAHALYAAPPRDRPERYVVDRQISAGYMHAGYPIMTGDDVAGAFVDLSLLRGAAARRVWGFYHELGHNFQQRDWTFDGTGEVTNNLFSLYGCETINGVPPMGTPHPALAPAAMRARLQKYVAGGAQFEAWKRDPFLALTMYIQLQQAFGWEPFTRVFAEYRNLSPDARPRTDAARRDQWMVRMSRATGKNLAPFFTAWGVPTSRAAQQSLRDLPPWMPGDFPAAKL